MGMLYINSVKIATPSKFTVDISDYDAEGTTTRNANGDLIRDRIGVKRKLNCEFPPMTQSEVSVLLSSVQDVFFKVTYPDPILGVTTKTMYVGDRNAPMYRHGVGESDILWEGLKMNFIEK